MAVQSTYDMVGIKEDISDVISNITPTDVPFQTSLKTGSIKTTDIKWLEDTIRASAANARAEGATATAATAATTPATRRNYTQIMSETVEVSDTADRVAVYGRASEMAYQVAKAGKGLKLDLERALVGVHQTAVAGDDSSDGAGTPRQFAGYYSQVTAGTSGNVYDMEKGDFAAAVIAAAPVGDAALTEAGVLAINQRLYTNGAEATVVLVKPSDSLVFANFAYKTSSLGATGIASVRGREVGDSATIVNVVDFYKSPFGTQKVVMDRHLYVSDALFYDPSHLSIEWLRPWSRTTLAKTGDKTTIFIVGEMTYKNRNWLSGGLIANVA